MTPALQLPCQNRPTLLPYAGSQILIPSSLVIVLRVLLAFSVAFALFRLGCVCSSKS